MYSNNVVHWKYIGCVKWEGCASGIFLIVTFILNWDCCCVNFNIDELEKFDLFVYLMLVMSESFSGWCLQVLDNPQACKCTVEFLGRKKSPVCWLNSSCSYLLWSHCIVWKVIYLKEGACMICLVAVLNVLQNYRMHFHMNTHFYWEEYQLYASQGKEQDFFFYWSSISIN